MHGMLLDVVDLHRCLSTMFRQIGADRALQGWSHEWHPSETGQPSTSHFIDPSGFCHVQAALAAKLLQGSGQTSTGNLRETLLH